MPEPKTCPNCDAPLPEDAPSGICPKCLMLAGLEDSAESNEAADGSAFAATTPQSGGFVPPEPALLAPHFPHLEIIELIGHGGMGAVYKARQTKLDRLVALKIIRPESADDPAFAERFNREARTLARLNHPNIVSIFDFGEVPLAGGGRQSPDVSDDSQPALFYFLMEYVDGATLRQLIQTDDLSPDEALAIVPQICDALQFAHDEGIVHRDVKPENILLDQRGRVKIADFGLAKLATRSDHDFTLTGTHQVMGTPRYMAPEQMEGSRTVDHRADIYSLGVVFYEMLTGQVPAGHFDPPSKRTPVDDRLDQVVMRALAHDPERRYQQASEISSHVNVIRGVTSDLDVAPSAEIGRRAFPERSPGPSTMLERAVSRIVGGMRHGGVKRLLACPAAPGVAAILLSLGLTATVFVPWGLSNDVAVANEFWGTGLETGWFHAYDFFSSTAVAIVGFLLAITLFAAGTSQRIPVWRPWSILFVGAVCLSCVALFYVSNRPAAGWRVESGFLGALGLAIALIIVAAWDVRMLLAQRTDKDPCDPVDDEYLSSLGGRDWVTLTKEQIEADDLPNVCIVCGRPTTERLNKNFSHQSEWAQVLTLIGMLFFVFPGLIISSLTERQQRIACPVCPRHRNHWSRFAWWASTGWLIPLTLGGFPAVGVWAAGLQNMVAIAIVLVGSVAGLILYLVPLIRMASRRVDVEDVTETEVRLRRVSAAFAKAAGGRTPPVAVDDASSEARDEPRFSRKAIAGAGPALLSVIAMIAFAAAALFVADGAPTQRSASVRVLLYPFLYIALPGVTAGIAATALGWLALSDIRNSEGRVTGLGLAFVNAMLFPLLLLYAVLFGLVLPTVGIPGFTPEPLERVLLAALIIAAIVWCPLAFLILRRGWRAVASGDDQSDAEELGEESSFPSRELAVMLIIVMPLLALIGFSTAWTDSAWALAGLALPWFVLGGCGCYYDGRPQERAANVAGIMGLLVSLGLIGYGVMLEDSLLPLLAIFSGIVGAFAGMFAGAAGRDEDDSDEEPSDETEADQPEDEDEEDAAGESTEAETLLDWAAGPMFLLGLHACFTMFTEGSEAFLASLRGAPASLDPTFWFTLAGPIVVAGAVAMWAETAYWLAITACVLCLPLGLSYETPVFRIVPFIAGGWGLLVLLTDARGQFPTLDDESIPDPPADSVQPTSRRTLAGWIVLWTAVITVIGFAQYDVHKDLAGYSYYVRDATAGRLVPQSGAYQSVSVEATGHHYSLRHRNQNEVPRSEVRFDLRPLDAAAAANSDDLVVTLPDLGYRYKDIGGYERSADQGLNEAVVLDWMKAAAVDVDLPGIQKEADALERIARGAFQTPTFELVDHDLFEGTAGEYTFTDRRIEEWQHAIWIVVAWIVGLATLVGLSYLRSSYPTRQPTIRASWLAAWILLPSLVAFGPYLYWRGTEVTTLLMRDHRGRSPLLLATFAGEPVRVRRLLARGADPNDGGNSLWWAAGFGETEILRELLRAGADVDEPYDHGITPLMLASATGEADCVRLLINAGADVNAQDRRIVADVYYIGSGTVSSKRKIDYGWQVDRQTPLILAAREGHVDVMQLLLEAGAKLGVTDGDGKYAADYAKESDDPEIRRVFEEFIQQQLTETASSEAVPQTDLHDACRSGDAKRVKELLDAGASVHDKDADGFTPLMAAAASGHSSLCQALLLLGADAAAQDEQGQTALMSAVEGSHEEVIRAFFEVDYHSRMGSAPSQFRRLAVDGGLLEGVDLTDVGSIEIATEARDRNGETALMKAAAAGDEICVKSLLGGTYVVGVDLRDNQGRSALMHAVTNEQTALIRSLASAAHDKVAVWSPETLGDMNTFHNSTLGTYSLFNLDSLRITYNDGKTAYQLAEEQESTEIAELLRKYLEMVVAKETQAIEMELVGVRWCYRDRAYAYQALGETEKAEADFASAGGGAGK